MGSEMCIRDRIWSEAIRLGKKPPEEVARKYVIVNLQLLGILSKEGLRDITKPPKPGSHVYKISPKDLTAIYNYDVSKKDSMPGYYISIGNVYGYEELPAVLDLRSINMHMAILGITGSGKSNTVGKIIEELGKKAKFIKGFKTIPAFIVDANADYKDYFEKPELISSYYRIYRLVFENSEIARKKGLTISDYLEEGGGSFLRFIKIDLNVFSPSELAELVIALYHGGKLEGKELQISYLATLLEELKIAEKSKYGIPARCLEGDKIDFNCLFNNLDILTNIIEYSYLIVC